MIFLSEDNSDIYCTHCGGLVGPQSYDYALVKTGYLNSSTKVAMLSADRPSIFITAVFLWEMNVW